MARAEADGPLAEHLQAIGKDECIYDDRDVYAVLEAASLITELEGEVERLQQALHDTRMLHAYDDDHPCEACREELLDASS